VRSVCDINGDMLWRVLDDDYRLDASFLRVSNSAWLSSLRVSVPEEPERDCFDAWRLLGGDRRCRLLAEAIGLGWGRWSIGCGRGEARVLP